ncbi:unnamed protein product [Cuscuta campestris]|uniref:MULE transposase domain-containing protein n=1 Tax=Cuscuta campestris TaxID=132261 RepID=A0A484LNF9_9ASTE|nr:unnamed protein product [Cuscuta campestris]
MQQYTHQNQSLLLTQFTQPLSLSSEDVCIAESTDSVSVESTPNVVISHYHPTTIRMDCIYKSKMDLQHHLQMFSIVNNFQFRTVTSTKTSYHVVCVDANCKWALRAVRVCGASLFQIRRFDSEHSCPVDFREGNHRQATSTLLAGLVAHRYADASKKPYQPIDLMDDMRREYGITMSCKKALVVKRKAMSKLYGSDDQSYRLLPAMCYKLEKNNPGSVISLTTCEDGKFKNMFFSHCAWRQAWIHCFPILIIYGTFMKAYFRGTLLTACTQDANRQIVPLAFGICDVENIESWLWFLSNVKHSLIERSDMCIISDRHDGILFAVDKVFPFIPHCYCTEHILRNLKGKFKGKSESIEWKFRAASRAATVEECEEYLSMLDEDDPRIRVYLDKIGVTKWSRSIGKRPGLSCYEFISTFYKLEALVCTYAGIVHPIGDVSGWVIPQEILSRKCDPLSCNKRHPGRPKKKRYPSVGEFRYGKRRVKQRCSRCKSHGHNMKSCTNPIPMADAALT